VKITKKKLDYKITLKNPQTCETIIFFTKNDILWDQRLTDVQVFDATQADVTALLFIVPATIGSIKPRFGATPT
jgi:hypothetical protein